MLIKRLDGMEESAEESSEEYKNAIEGNEWKRKKNISQDCNFFFISCCCFASNLSINKTN